MNKINTLQFANGVQVYIESLYQFQTYGGQSFGVSTEEDNNEIIKEVLKRVKERAFSDKIYSIEPKQKVMKLKAQYEPTPMKLPKYTCVAELRYYKSLKPFQKPTSCLSLIWYQERFAFPIDDSILKKIGKLDWKKISEVYAND